MRQLIPAMTIALLLISPATRAELENGQPFPTDFSPPVVNGDDLDLSEYQGKIVVVAFWATWCRPCLEEFPYLMSIQRQATDEHVQVIAVSWNESRRTARGAVSNLPDTGFVFALDRKGRHGRSLGVESIPHTIVIGADGIVKYQSIGFSESSIESLINAINVELIAKQQSDAQPEISEAPQSTAPEST